VRPVTTTGSALRDWRSAASLRRPVSTMMPSTRRARSTFDAAALLRRRSSARSTNSGL
jgi:hypothetical protein